MDNILKLLEGFERVQTHNIMYTKLESWNSEKESSDFINGDYIVSTNIIIKTSLTDEPHEYVAEAEGEVSYNSGVTDKINLLPTHEKQMRQALQRFDGWMKVVRIEPTERKYIDEDTGKEKVTIITRLIAADTREVTP